MNYYQIPPTPLFYLPAAGRKGGEGGLGVV